MAYSWADRLFYLMYPSIHIVFQKKIVLRNHHFCSFPSQLHRALLYIHVCKIPTRKLTISKTSAQKQRQIYIQSKPPQLLDHICNSCLRVMWENSQLQCETLESYPSEIPEILNPGISLTQDGQTCHLQSLYEGNLRQGTTHSQ